MCIRDSEEFEYAKKALEYKVSQYVLKYESQDAVLDAVLQAARQIEAESESRLLRGKSLDMQRRNFFREISCNKMELGEIQAQAGRLGISLSCGRCRMASVSYTHLDVYKRQPAAHTP